MKMQITSRKMLFTTGILLAFSATTLVGCGESTAAATEKSGETPAATTEKTTEKKWTELLTFKGSGMKKSAPFHLSGGKARVKYSFKETEMGAFSFSVVPEGEDEMSVMPDAEAEKSETSESYITKSEGNYYIAVNSANGTWTVTVEEEK